MTIGRTLALWTLLITATLSGLSVAFSVIAYRELRRFVIEQSPLTVGVEEVLSETLQNVQESFAYIASGDLTEKEDFRRDLARLRSEVERLRSAMAPSAPGFGEEVRRLEAIALHLDMLGREAERLFEQYESAGRVERATFLDYEAQIDGLETEVSRYREVARAKASADASAVLDRALRAILAVGCGGVLLAVLSGVILTRTISAPLRALRDSTAALAAGDLDRTVPLTGTSELRDLAAAFNAMAGSLKRSRTEQLQVARAQRLESLAVLGAGIAHEMTNPLATIASAAEGLLLRLGRLEPGHLPERTIPHLEIIRDEAFRAKSIARSLLDLAHQWPAPDAALDVNEIARSAHALVALRTTRLDRAVRLELGRDDSLGGASGHAGLLRQVLFNILDNAIDAAPEKDGEVVLRTRRVEVDGRPWVRFECEDNGPGIGPEESRRLFEPLYTTKGPGGGTGLGLAMSRRILERHRGRIELLQRAGERGTVVHVDLPIAGDGAERAALPAPPSAAAPRAAAPGSGGLVAAVGAGVAAAASGASPAAPASRAATASRASPPASGSAR